MQEETRAALKAAADKVVSLKSQIQVLETAQDRAQASADQANRELAVHAGLDREITKWRVDQVKKGGNTKTLPTQLQKKVTARRDAAEELEQSESTLEAISEELESLQSQLNKATLEQKKCAVSVLHGMGDLLASELRTINRRRSELRQLLWWLGEVQLQAPGEAPRNIGISAAADEALNMGNGFDFPGNASPGEEIVRRWARRLDAICADPAAEITAPKPLTPSDYIPGEPQRFVGQGLPWAPGTPGSWKSEQA